MVDCDMCGKKGIQAQRVKVEGTEMTVCESCARFGTPLANHGSGNNNFSRQKKTFSNPDEDKRIVLDYADRIKQAREREGLKQSDLATKLSEKESVLHSVESGHAKPTFKLARKLQKFFHITLIESIDEQRGSLDTVQTAQRPPLTMEEKVLAALKKKK